MKRLNTARSKIALTFVFFCSMVGTASADYSTDMQASFVAAIGSLLTDAGLMLGDVIPVVFGVAILFALLKLGKKFFNKAT